MSAVSYLHSHTIIHGDLKPENIFLQSNYQVRLSDFGLAKIPSEPTASRFSSSSTQGAGTWRYMGPEFFIDVGTDLPPRGPAADIWALAWTFYVVLTGLHPYSNASQIQILNSIQNHHLPLEPSDIPSQDAPTEDLLRLQSTIWPIMRQCWEINPTRRPKAEEVQYRLCEEEAFALESAAKKFRETNPDKARGTLAAAALGYLCHGWREDAYKNQIQIGWILIDQQQFLATQAHFNSIRRAIEADALVVACKRGLARTALELGNFDEAIEQYYSALVLCRAGGLIDYEYMIIRDTANAVLDHARDQNSPEEAFRSQNNARRLFQEALSFSMDPGHVNLEYQAQVRCDLVQLESDAGNETTAQAHATAAFQCALETGRSSVADGVYNYLFEIEVLSEAQLNAFRIDLLELHGERGVDSLASSWVASVS